MGDVGFDDLGTVKALLRKFFSTETWTAIDAATLARAIGPPPSDVDADDVTRHRLAPDLTLVAGWVDSAFVIDVEASGAAPVPTVREVADLGETFDYRVTPEPTPNPRTLRFATPARPPGPSEEFKRGGPADDPRVAAIFAVDEDIVGVLLGADFVAVSIRRPQRWADLLAAVLRVVDDGFGAPADEDVTGPTTAAASTDLDVRGAGSVGRRTRHQNRSTRLDRAWSALGSLDASDPHDLEAILNATRSTDGAQRQVAARLLTDATPEVAIAAWTSMLADPSRGVRRAVLDAAVDAAAEDGEMFRSLLERALADGDAWVRWKALHGLAVLGAAPSVSLIEPLLQDGDFRVRLEANNALSSIGS